MPLTGAVVASALGSYNSSMSFGDPDPSLSIVVPPGIAPGKYFVHLMCQGYYVDDYTFAPSDVHRDLTDLPVGVGSLGYGTTV